MNTKITPTLDKIEETLPPISGRILRLNRKVAGVGLNALHSTGRAMLATVRSSMSKDELITALRAS